MLQVYKFKFMFEYYIHRVGTLDLETTGSCPSPNRREMPSLKSVFSSKYADFIGKVKSKMKKSV